MQRLGKDLFWLRGLGGFINAYLWHGDTLLDAGAPALAHAFFLEMKANGFDRRHIDRALVSHCHLDHAGGLMHIGHDIDVHGSPEDLAVLKGEAQAPDYHPRFGFLVHAAEALLPTYRLAAHHTPRPVPEGGTVHGWRALRVPGHTPGSLLWYQKETRTVFVGDLFVHHFGFLQGPSPLFTPDYGLAVRSMSRLKELEIETVLFGHGRPLVVEAEKKLHRLIDGLQVRRLRVETA